MREQGKELSSTREEFGMQTGVVSEIREIPTTCAPALGKGVEECWMDFDGARMRYLRAGSGPPIILLHGLMGYSFSWRYVIPALVPLRTCYAPDMLGAGFSDRAKVDHSMPATALRLLQFVEGLKLGSFDLLGTSRGGAVAMSAAAECVKRGKPQIRSLILVAPVNPYSAHGRWLAPFCGSRLGTVMARAVLEQFPSLYPYWHGRMFADSNKIPSDSLDGYKAPIAKPGLFEHALSIVRTWSADLRELEELLPTLSSIPTMLMWGSKDPAVYFSSMERLARHLPGAEKVVFQGVGHLPYEECAEEFNRVLIRFLQK
jgi:pimeloyl-ACP methyl ester carboxylesterase